MPVVNIQLYEGRTQQQKDDIAMGVAETISRVADVPLEATVVIFSDTKRSDWHVGTSAERRSRRRKRSPYSAETVRNTPRPRR